MAVSFLSVIGKQEDHQLGSSSQRCIQEGLDAGTWRGECDKRAWFQSSIAKSYNFYLRLFLHVPEDFVLTIFISHYIHAQHKQLYMKIVQDFNIYTSQHNRHIKSYTNKYGNPLFCFDYLHLLLDKSSRVCRQWNRPTFSLIIVGVVLRLFSITCRVNPCLQCTACVAYLEMPQRIWSILWTLEMVSVLSNFVCLVGFFYHLLKSSFVKLGKTDMPCPFTSYQVQVPACRYSVI